MRISESEHAVDKTTTVRNVHVILILAAVSAAILTLAIVAVVAVSAHG
jgi:hypothetical protein